MPGSSDAGPRQSSISATRRAFGSVDAVVVEWDFGIRGGTFGVAETDAFVAACSEAIANGLPLVSITRTGGTRLQEGMRALVGIPRSALALRDLGEAGLPHVCVVDHPTTGGVWVGVCSRADLRVAVAGATVGFSGPRVVEAMTGRSLPPGANTAERALAAGLVDAVEPTVDAALDRVGRALALLGDTADDPSPVADGDLPAERGWQQVSRSRAVGRPSGAELITQLVDDPQPLRGGDGSVAAALGRVASAPVVLVAGAAERAGMVTVAGYRLVERACAVAGHLRLPLVTLVDTAGADPLPDSEDGGIAGAIADAMGALLDCTSPTVSVLHGEGGSGGALAVATTDLVAVTATGWFAALGPAGAAAALRSSPEEAADLMRVAPADLLAEGFADAVAPSEPEQLRRWLAARLRALSTEDPGRRLGARRRRWESALPE